jgi:hypothetical protein
MSHFFVILQKIKDMKNLMSFGFTLLLICVISSEVTAQRNEFAIPPEVDFSYSKFDYYRSQNESKETVLEIEVWKEGKEIKYKTFDSIYVSLDFIPAIQKITRENVGDFSKNFLAVNLKVEADIPYRILRDIETELRKANQLRIYYVNKKGARLGIILPPIDKLGCFKGYCCETQSGYCLEEKVKVGENKYEKVTSTFPNQIECFKYYYRETGIYIQLKANSILVGGRAITSSQLLEIIKLRFSRVDPHYFVTGIDIDENANYGEFLETYSLIRKFMTDQRSILSQKKFNLSLDKLSKQDHKVIRNTIPIVIMKFESYE